MKRFFLVFLLSAAAVLNDNAWAGDAAMLTEIDPLKPRQGSGKQKEQPESKDSGPLGAIAHKAVLGGVIAGSYQYESVSRDGDMDDFGRGAVPVQPEVSIKPTDRDEVFFKFGFAAGNGLNVGKQPFVLAPWAADLEDDVKDINGRNRDYLLAAWYKHVFTFGEEHTLGITGGIIDATDYLDENRYANDEYTQFMNEALVNGPNAFLPSYDIGGAVEWEMDDLAIKAVIMQVGENDEGKSYYFYGIQVGYTLETWLGEGTYRLLINATSDDFGDPDDENEAALKAVMFSFDQSFGEILGGWIRVGWGDDKAIIDFKDLHSGGINISGKLWGREGDNIGIGYVWLRGGNQDIDQARVAEGYVRFGLTDIFALTLDLQYLDERYKKGAGDNVDGWITGIRMTAKF